jgi:hypothetical protein
MTTVGALVSGLFLVLALWHVWMAFGPAMDGVSGGVPSVGGKPLFVPSRATTLVVAVGLLLLGGLVAATAGLVPIGIPLNLLSWMSYALAAGLFARAVGEFRYVGFFKRVRGTPFARMDTLFYSPLCVALGVGVAVVAWGTAG